MGISIDGSFAVQIVSFFILWALLKRFLFDPVLHVLEQREARTQGNRETAEHLTAEARTAQASYEERIHAVRHEVLEQSDVQRKVIAADERRLIAAARDAAGERLTQTRAEIAAQIEQARQTLRRDAVALGERAAAKVLGRAV